MSDGVLHYFGTNVLGGLKEGTAVSANRLLRRAGVFWQRESRDHVVRNSDELDRIILYVLENPDKAGLCTRWEDWRLTYGKEES